MGCGCRLQGGFIDLPAHPLHSNPGGGVIARARMQDAVGLSFVRFVIISWGWQPPSQPGVVVKNNVWIHTYTCLSEYILTQHTNKPSRPRLPAPSVDSSKRSGAMQHIVIACPACHCNFTLSVAWPTARPPQPVQMPLFRQGLQQPPRETAGPQHGGCSQLPQTEPRQCRPCAGSENR